MRRLRWLVALSLTAVAALLVLKRARRFGAIAYRATASLRGASTAGAEKKGHPWFAATYDLVTWWGEAKLLSQLRPLVAGRATGKVLEIGAGTGANFPYYRDAESIVAVEPDPFMLKRAQRRAEQLRLPIEFHEVPAEALPFPDASFDTVVATLVICTVADPALALSEARRVLRPGGTFRFIEHVRSASSAMAQVQDALTPIWARVGAGCHLDRQTAQTIAMSGFQIVELEERPVPLTPLIFGLALRNS